MQRRSEISALITALAVAGPKKVIYYKSLRSKHDLDDKHKNAAENSILEIDKMLNTPMKICLVGKSFVGKASIINAVVNEYVLATDLIEISQTPVSVTHKKWLWSKIPGEYMQGFANQIPIEISYADVIVFVIDRVPYKDEITAFGKMDSVLHV